MHILLLSDGIVGHYKQSEGIAAALARQRTVQVSTLPICFPKLIPRKLLPHLARHLPPALFLKLCGFSPAHIAKPDLIVSAGGATLGFNAALAAYFKVPNIFTGSARGFAPEHITLTLLPYPSAAKRAGHLYALKPSPVNPDRLPPVKPWQGLAGCRASLLVGGSTAHMHFSDAEWKQLLDGVVSMATLKGMEWTVVTSRRTPQSFYNALDMLHSEQRELFQLTDFRDCYRTSIDDAYATDLLLVTGDSLSMISESVATNRPTIVLFPAQTRPFRDKEAITALEEEKHIATLDIKEFSVDFLEEKAKSIQPAATNHLDNLGLSLISRMNL